MSSLSAPEPAKRVAFDVSGLLAWYCFNTRVSGIQRLTERVLSAPAIAGNPSTFCVGRIQGDEGFSLVDKALITALSDAGRRDGAIASLRELCAVLSARANRPRWRCMLTRRWRGNSGLGGAQAVFRDSDTLVNLAEFWTPGDQIEAYRRVHETHGVQYIQLIHDLIPQTHPHVCHEETNVLFRSLLRQLVCVARGYVVPSEHVRRELAAYLAPLGAAERPLAMLPYGWEFGLAQAGADDASLAEVLRRNSLSEGAYFLLVGTLEPRKNHVLVVRAMHSLRDKLGGKLLPVVFAGRIGWKIESLLNEMRSLDYLGGRIRVLNNLSDAELAAIYRGCRFTVFPSFVEGWGLPVQESLQFGKPCLASSASSIPEVGLDLAEYFDPHDATGFTARLETWMLDDAHIAAMTARIAAFRAETSLPTWNDSAEAVLHFAREIRRPGVTATS